MPSTALSSSSATNEPINKSLPQRAMKKRSTTVTSAAAVGAARRSANQRSASRMFASRMFAIRKVPWSLLASLAPGLLFFGGLMWLEQQHQMGWFSGRTPPPWELFIVAACGVAATIAGIADWRYHRKQGIRVGPNEHKYELLALAGGGVPLFVLMAIASLSTQRKQLLLPILVVVLFTAVAISYDEFVFHRKRCGRYETMLHRVLVLGHTSAWLAWMHWCFVRGGSI